MNAHHGQRLLTAAGPVGVHLALRHAANPGWPQNAAEALATFRAETTSEPVPAFPSYARRIAYVADVLGDADLAGISSEGFCFAASHLVSGSSEHPRLGALLYRWNHIPTGDLQAIDCSLIAVLGLLDRFAVPVWVRDRFAREVAAAQDLVRECRWISSRTDRDDGDLGFRRRVSLLSREASDHLVAFIEEQPPVAAAQAQEFIDDWRAPVPSREVPGSWRVFTPVDAAEPGVSHDEG